MGKTISPIFKFQGTIGDLVFVNSKTFKPHIRSKKNSKTPFEWTANFAENNLRLHACNDYASPIFQALKPESHDGLLWSRMVKLLFAGLKAGEPLGLQKLKGLECNLTYPMHDVITGAYDFSATREQNEVRIRVLLEKHPPTADSMPRTGYQLRVVAIFTDVANERVIKREVLGPLTPYNTAPEAVNLTIPLPSPDTPCMLLMGIVPHLRNEGAVRIMSDSGMKVVWVDEPEGGGQKSEVGSQMPETASQLLEGGVPAKPVVETVLSGVASVKLEVNIRQPAASSVKPAAAVQVSTGNASYWQQSTTMGLVRFAVSQSS